MTEKEKQIVIIGAGIMGASIGYHLAKAGGKVTILEKGTPGQGATADSFAWINASRGKKPFHYYELNLAGVHAWKQLELELNGELQVIWGGSLEWSADGETAAEINRESQNHQGWGYPLRQISADEFEQLEPNLKAAGFKTAIYTDIEGHVDPVLATQVLLNQAQQHNAKLYTGCEVTEIERSQDGPSLIKTSLGDIEADLIVIASGNHSPTVANMVGVSVPMQDSPGVLVHSKPQAALINRIVLSPHGHMKQKPDGRVVLGASFEGGSGTDHSLEAGEGLLHHASQSLPQLDDAAVEKVTLGWRVLPADGLPIIGFVKDAADVYLAVMHSGITLSPLVGNYAASEILEGIEIDQLKPYRLGRFE